MKTVTLLALLVLSACASGVDRKTYLNTLIGQPESEVVRQLGVPSRTYDTAGHKFLAYAEQRQDYLPGGPFFGGGFFGGGFYGPSFGYGYGFPSQVVTRVCETTFDVAGGRVQTWSLRGNACS